MDTAHALELLTPLANGMHPFTGTPFPADSPYQHPDLVRALFLAVRVLEATRNPHASGAQRRGAGTAGSVAGMHTGMGKAPGTPAVGPLAGNPPVENPVVPGAATGPASAAAAPKGGRGGNSGKAWSAEEDAALLAGYDAGNTIALLARTHERSKLAIEARLARYQRVPMPSGLRSGSTGTATGNGLSGGASPGAAGGASPGASGGASPGASGGASNGQSGPTSAASGGGIPATIPLAIPGDAMAPAGVSEPRPPVISGVAAPAYHPRLTGMPAATPRGMVRPDTVHPSAH